MTRRQRRLVPVGGSAYYRTLLLIDKTLEQSYCARDSIIAKVIATKHTKAILHPSMESDLFTGSSLVRSVRCSSSVSSCYSYFDFCSHSGAAVVGEQKTSVLY